VGWINFCILLNPSYFTQAKFGKLYWSSLVHVAQFQMACTPLAWYKEENQSYQVHRRFSQTTLYLRVFLMKDGTQRRCMLVLTAHMCSPNLLGQRFLVHLPTA
jgi:hypothetical protein